MDVLTDPIIVEAMLRTLRVLTFITGALVLIDSIGIMISPAEHPPHKPKWSAISWCIIAATAASVAGFLLQQKAGLVGENDPAIEKFTVFFLYIGLTIGFTCRAISRAHRPLFTVIAVVGMSVAGIVFSIWDLVR